MYQAYRTWGQCIQFPKLEFSRYAFDGFRESDGLCISRSSCRMIYEPKGMIGNVRESVRQHVAVSA